MSAIDKPGFYTSKHGKCEVLNVDGGWAFGYRFSKCRQKMSVPTFWEAQNGRNHHGNQYDITGPWVEPRKPMEAWCLIWGINNRAYFERESDAFVDRANIKGARLIHLREVEDEKP